MSAGSYAVELTAIHKSFGSVKALEDVHLAVEPGTIHAIVGENGAGKTTLMKVLYGALLPDAGVMRVNGHEVRFRHSRQAIAAGIGMVSQHYGIIPPLSILQNLMLGEEGGPFLNLSAAKARADSLAAPMGFKFDWDAPAETLSPGAGQRLEILKLLWRNSRIMILDEPTAMLSPEDAAAVFESVQRLVAQGATVLLVTHRLPEVMNYCHALTVLRGGRYIDRRLVASTSAADVAELMVGESPAAPIVTQPALGDPVLQVQNLTLPGVKGTTFTLRAGEVVGIAGVDGSGQRELFRALVGVSVPVGGSIQLDGRDITAHPPAQRTNYGLRAVFEDRPHEAIIESWPLTENSILGLQKTAMFSRNGNRINDLIGWTERVAGRFGTRYGSVHQPLRGLSGGNQQRFVVGRALESDPRCLLAFQPTRGLDIKATAEIYEAIRHHARAGNAALVIGFDLDELLNNVDRMLVMYHGELRSVEGKDRAQIGRLMVGAA